MAGENLQIRQYLGRLNDPVLSGLAEAIFNDLLALSNQSGGDPSDWLKSLPGYSDDPTLVLTPNGAGGFEWQSLT